MKNLENNADLSRKTMRTAF